MLLELLELKFPLTSLQKQWRFHLPLLASTRQLQFQLTLQLLQLSTHQTRLLLLLLQIFLLSLFQLSQETPHLLKRLQLHPAANAKLLTPLNGPVTQTKMHLGLLCANQTQTEDNGATLTLPRVRYQETPQRLHPKLIGDGLGVLLPVQLPQMISLLLLAPIRPQQFPTRSPVKLPWSVVEARAR